MNMKKTIQIDRGFADAYYNKAAAALEGNWVSRRGA